MKSVSRFAIFSQFTLQRCNSGLVTLAICSSLVSLQAFAHDDDSQKGITATGTCLKKVTQDRAAVSLTTNILAQSPGAASGEATKASQKLRDALVALKLADMTLETTGFSVAEDRQYENKKLVSKGFRARIGISVETSDISRIGEAIAVAAKHDIKEVEDLRTFVSSEKHKAESEACLEIATRNARDKAQKLAKGAGVKLGKVIRIAEGSAASPRVNYKYASMMTADAESGGRAATAPTIDARAEDMTVSATVTFANEP